MLCGDLNGRSKREGIYAYIQLIHFIVQQKLTQHCKATIPPKKKKKKKTEREKGRALRTPFSHPEVPRACEVQL